MDLIDKNEDTKMTIDGKKFIKLYCDYNCVGDCSDSVKDSCSFMHLIKKSTVKPDQEDEDIWLLSCPICKGEVYLSQEDCYGNIDDNWLIHCDHCGLQFGFTAQFLSKEEAAYYWNNRKY